VPSCFLVEGDEKAWPTRQIGDGGGGGGEHRRDIEGRKGEAGERKGGRVRRRKQKIKE
jgi:hypothetical protein